MKPFCQNEHCENPGAKVVPVSVRKASDQKRTLCVACEEAYSIGVQHGTMVAKTSALHANRRELATILAALRFHQDEDLQAGRGIPDRFIKGIATDGGVLKPLNYQEVSELCERLNAGPSGLAIDPPPRGSRKEGGST